MKNVALDMALDFSAVVSGQGTWLIVSVPLGTDHTDAPSVKGRGNRRNRRFSRLSTGYTGWLDRAVFDDQLQVVGHARQQPFFVRKDVAACFGTAYDALWAHRGAVYQLTMGSQPGVFGGVHTKPTKATFPHDSHRRVGWPELWFDSVLSSRRY